ncbi:MAG: CDP-alcohol phosphatidyltransferase family protein [Oscillospiraceae bacterium]|nr:CDP-alcohol phosphatidyltransferase family protein [Oscillospiraceae bacterium]
MTAIKRNLPNIITISRIVFSAALVFAIFTVFNCSLTNAVLILCFSAILFSDIFDGYIARKMNLATITGARLDLIADIIYVLGTIGILAHFKQLPLWFPLVLAANFAGFLITSKLLGKGKKRTSPVFDKLGKTAAILTMLLPGVFVFRCFVPDIEATMRICANILTVLFCISFVYRITLVIRKREYFDN